MPATAERVREVSAALEQSVPAQRILIVEDLEDARNSLQEMINLSLHLPVDVAEDGVRGLEMLEERPYSVVITDLRMPNMGGMKLIEEIQSRHIPTTIIVTT